MAELDPNYSRLVSQLSQAPQNAGAKDPKQQQQNAESQLNAFQKIAKPSGASGSTAPPVAPSSDLESGAADHALAPAADAAATGDAAGTIGGAGTAGAVGGVAADAAAGEGIGEIADLAEMLI